MGADAQPIVLSVLAPVLDEERHIRETVATMTSQLFPGALEFIFIDGRSQDRTREILEELRQADPRIVVLDNPERRTPNALNVGLRAARGRFVARMDAHTHYPIDYLQRGVARLELGGVEHVSGPQIARGAGRWSRRVAIALSTRLGTGGAVFRSVSGHEIEVDSGFTGIWRRATLKRHGGWDEGWPQNQDGELAARIRKAGGSIVCLPEMAADYVPRESLKSLGRQYWRYGTYRAKTSHRHPESLRASHLLAPALVLAAVSAVVPGRAGRPGRLVLLSYGLAVAAVSAGAARDECASDALALPLVFAVMHTAWGLGFVNGSIRFGPPLAGLARLVPRRR